MRHTLAAILAGAMLTGSALLLAQAPRSVEVQLKAAQHKEEVEGDLQGAIALYQALADRARGTERATAAAALLRMAGAYQKLGDAQARAVYERVIREFADQRDSAAAAKQFLAALPSPPAALSAPAARALSDSGAIGRSSSPSADGRYVSFTDESGNVALRDVRTGLNRRLTQGGDWWNAWSSGPVVSPDGLEVAYVWYLHPDKAEVRVVSAVEPVSAPRVAFQTGMNETPYKIAWAPDGKRLHVVRTLLDRTSQVGTLTIADRSFRSIKSLEWRNLNRLSLSPDGRFLAYDVPAGEVGSPRDVVVLATDGSQETTVVQHPANDSFPLWSPDGSHLLFLSDRTGRNALWMVPIAKGRANGNPVSIRPDVGPIQLLGLTKAGTLYYFEPGASRANLHLAELEGLRVTKPPVPLTERLVTANVGSTWSRDGEYLAYYSFSQVSADTRTGMLVIRSARTGQERTVPLPTRVSTRFGVGPKWFPDNRSVLVESGDAEGPGFGFYRLTIETGNTELLTRLPRDVSSYDLTPDGRAIVYTLLTEQRTYQKLIRFDIASRQDAVIVDVTQEGREIVALAVSPDGTQIATTVIGGFLEVVPMAGGQPLELFRPAAAREENTGALREGLTWTPDQRFLLFTRGDRSLWKVLAAGGTAEKTGIENVKSPSLHPDGRRLVFSNPFVQYTSGADTPRIMFLENLTKP